MADPLSDAPTGSRTFPPTVAAFAAGAVLLAASGLHAFRVLRRPPAPPPVDVASDPLLAEGREVYLARCVSCHGATGKGDGPIAKGLTGPPVGNLSDANWKHGDRPDQVVGVITAGVRDTSMSGWKVLGPESVRAVAAYVYYLGGRAVPAELRQPPG